jgi:glucosaminylphosphatidylinositol acyltransferase
MTFPPPAAWNATNTDDVTETFICSSMIVPSAALAQTLPLIVHWCLGRDNALHAPLTTLAEMAGWAGPVIAIFASPNVEGTWQIAVVCFTLAIAAVMYVASHATPAAMDGVHFLVWPSSARSQPLTSVSITYVRISSLLFTALGIFCVDFPNYGERFMKSDTIGLTLMDIGIGCSLFSSGLSDGLRQRRKPLVDRLVWNSMPLLIIAMFRTGILSSIGYRVEVSEYGQHWNAFVTFAAMPLLMSIVERIPSKRPWLVSLVCMLLITIPYNAWLLKHTEYFMHEEERRNIIEANREGIASVLGFFAIFLGGRIYAQRGALRDNASWAAVLRDQTVALSLCVIAIVIDQGVAPQVMVQAFSRRICNTPYVMFCIGMNAFLTRLCIGLNRWFLPVLWSMQRRSSISSSVAPLGFYTSQVNAHQLVYFVFSNIVTGLVNVFCDTHSFTDFASYFVQAGYVLGLGLIALGMPDLTPVKDVLSGKKFR